MRIKKRPKVLKSGVFVYKFVYIVRKCLIFKRYCGERGTKTHYFVKCHEAANPRKKGIHAILLILYKITKHHLSPHFRVQIRVRLFFHFSSVYKFKNHRTLTSPFA